MIRCTPDNVSVDSGARVLGIEWVLQGLVAASVTFSFTVVPRRVAPGFV